MTRPNPARAVEDAWNCALVALLTRRGWHPTVVPYAGYGSPDLVRVLARVQMARSRTRTPADLEQRRGWRNFVTAEVARIEVVVAIGPERHVVRTDASGHVDVRLPNPGLEPGWREAALAVAGSEPVAAPVLIVDGRESFGIVSDIDDTVIRTFLPRPLIAAYTTLVLREQGRRPVRGMSELYAALMRAHPGAPTVYVSTGAWNNAATLTRFLRRHGFPAGPLLLTDWGPTNTGWFRSGQEHKRACLRTLAEDLPRIRWLLVGDDGQRDPALYAEFARARPERVRAIAIRQLSAGEHVLAHGTPSGHPGADDDGTGGSDGAALGVPEVHAPDGDGLARALARVDLA